LTDIESELVAWLKMHWPSPSDVARFLLLRRLGWSRVLEEAEGPSQLVRLCGSFFEDLGDRDQVAEECVCILRGVQSLAERSVADAMRWFFAASGDSALFEVLCAHCRPHPPYLEAEVWVAATPALIDFFVREATSEVAGIAQDLKHFILNNSVEEMRSKTSSEPIACFAPVDDVASTAWKELFSSRPFQSSSPPSS
jgi:hypothetical protein